MLETWIYRVSHGKRMFLRKTKLCEYFNKNFIMYIETFTKLCHYGIFRSEKLCLTNRRRRRLKSIHSRSDTNRTGAGVLSFYYPRLLHCLDQMLAVMSLSQHRVSSSKTVKPRTPCGGRCIGHAVST